MLSYTCSLNSNAWAKFSVEVSADDLHVFRGLDDSLDHVVCLLHMVISKKWHVCARQSDVLLVDGDRCCNGTLADAFGPFFYASTCCS